MPAKRCCVALLPWMWLVTSLAMVVAADGALQVTLDERQLLLDDVRLAKIDNLKRTMHQPQKKGAVIRGDYVRYPGCTLQTRSTPIWDPNDDVYRLWVMGLVPSNSVGLTVTGNASAVYESKDGLNWYAPNLERVAYKGTKNNTLSRQSSVENASVPIALFMIGSIRIPIAVTSWQCPMSGRGAREALPLRPTELTGWTPRHRACQVMTRN